MVVVVFRSRLRKEALEEFTPTAQRMLELASAMPGFVSYKVFASEDGERLSLIEFDSEEHEQAWRDHPEHRAAQRLGRERFYEEYRLQVCRTVRDYGFRREEGE
jgi:heme-degrading monooxygenase HmoA